MTTLLPTLLLAFVPLIIPGLIVLVGFLYFLPGAFAAHRGHPNKGAIFVLNLLLGWTFLGWAAAMIWACTAISPQDRLPRRGASSVPSWMLWIGVSLLALWIGASLAHRPIYEVPASVESTDDDVADGGLGYKKVILSLAPSAPQPRADKLCSTSVRQSLSKIIVKSSHAPDEVRVNRTQWRSLVPTKRRDVAVSISVCRSDGLPIAIFDESEDWSATYSQAFGYEERQ
jgi:hypothetical protein